MRNPAGTIYGSQEIFQHYRELHPDSQVAYSLFLKILKSYFKGIVSLLLKGWVWNMGRHLSSVRIQRIERKFTKPTVDYGATRKLHRERPGLPKDTLVYFTNQPYWYRFYWSKDFCTIPNKTVYRLDFTCGPKGNTRKITQTLAADPFAHLKYLP